MGVGPLVSAAAAGADACASTPTSTTGPICCPRCSCSPLGLTCTVAPLTATVLADADEHNAGIASAVNNAIARVANLHLRRRARRRGGRAVHRRPGRQAARPARAPPSRRRGAPRWPGCPASRPSSRPRSQAFHFGIGVAAAMVALGGVLGPGRYPQPAPRGELRGLRRGRPGCAGAAGPRAGQPACAAVTRRESVMTSWRLGTAAGWA